MMQTSLLHPEVIYGAMVHSGQVPSFPPPLPWFSLVLPIRCFAHLLNVSWSTPRCCRPHRCLRPRRVNAQSRRPFERSLHATRMPHRRFCPDPCCPLQGGRKPRRRVSSRQWDAQRTAVVRLHLVKGLGPGMRLWEPWSVGPRASPSGLIASGVLKPYGFGFVLPNHSCDNNGGNTVA